jgi:hypothetical protein
MPRLLYLGLRGNAVTDWPEAPSNAEKSHRTPFRQAKISDEGAVFAGPNPAATTLAAQYSDLRQVHNLPVDLKDLKELYVYETHISTKASSDCKPHCPIVALWWR